MNTPIIDFVKKYSAEGVIRFHMPGHKGRDFLGLESMDITEIKGADSLYEAEGAIAESELNASRLFGFGHTFYSTEGSSQCLRAMIYLALLNSENNKNRLILAARNIHKSFIHACALLDLSVEWLYPLNINSSICQCTLSPQQVDIALQSMSGKPFAVYITAPDYLGYSPNIKGIAEICEKHRVPLLVDNAHGAYLKFLNPSQHPIDQGAFMSCDSAHKTLPVLTGGAYLQLSSSVPTKIVSQAKNALSLFGSTSPSYLTLQSLDFCNKYIFDNYPEKLDKCINNINKAKTKLKAYGWNIADSYSDPLKIVINSSSMGYSGEQLADILRSNKIECEFADSSAVVLMITPENTAAELNYLTKIMQLPKKDMPSSPMFLKSTQGINKMSIRDAFFKPHEIISTQKSIGRICASPSVSCPPAIPIIISGDLITEENVKILKAYGVEEIEVVVE